MAKLTCEQCGKEFTVPPVEVRRGRRFCSPSCWYDHKRERVKSTCKICGKEFETRQYEINRGKGKFCSRECSSIYHSRFCGKDHWNYGAEFTEEHKRKISEAQIGKKSHNWNGGKRKRNSGPRKGYVEITVDGKYVLEHRHIAEGVLGRKLKKNEIVHHINGDKSDNRHCNLLICTNSYHQWFERKMAHLYKQEHFAQI